MLHQAEAGGTGRGGVLAPSKNVQFPFRKRHPGACSLSRLALLDVLVLIGGFETDSSSLISDH